MDPSDAGFRLVASLFALLKHKQHLSLTWVTHALYNGAEYEAGVTWLSLTFEQNNVLAFIPKEGIFEYNGKLWLLLQLYPEAQRDKFGLPVLHIPSKFAPEERMVMMNSDKLSNVVPLWLSYVW